MIPGWGVIRAGGWLEWTAYPVTPLFLQGPYSGKKLVVWGVHGKWDGDSSERPGPRASHKRMWLHTRVHNGSRGNDSAFADGERISTNYGYEGICADEGIFSNYDLPGAAGVREHGGAQADDGAIVNFNVFRIFVVEIHVVADEDLAGDADAAKLMDQGSERRRSRTESGNQREDPVC